MSICFSGMDAKLETSTIEITVSNKYPLINLGNVLNWKELEALVINDLKQSTPKLKWWLGRKLILRIHLGVFLLQRLYKMTDRGIEEAIIGNAVFQVFCGRTIVKKWHSPDHTKIEVFRNRLSPETQRKIVSYTAKLAVSLGFADPSKMDVDSTVQEANMSYPSDARLLVKLGVMGKKVVDYFQAKPSGMPGKFFRSIKHMGRALSSPGQLVPKAIGLLEKLFGFGSEIDLQTIRKKARKYFFLPGNAARERKRIAFQELYTTVAGQMKPVIEMCLGLSDEVIKNLPWHIKRTVEQIRLHGQKYLHDVGYFAKTGKLKVGKILSFHLQQVACIVKGKLGKAKEFGRVFQLGRLAGNFFIVLPSTNTRMEDKSSIIPMVREHKTIFGSNVLESLATDKGYYSKNNVMKISKNIQEVGIQVPSHVRCPSPAGIDQNLKDRRAGIEPLIGHIKEFGLRRSRAKSDISTLASGYRSVLGFNLHQLMNRLGDRKQTISI